MNVICQSAAASPLLQYKRGMVVDGSYALDIIGEVSRQDHCPMPLAARVRQQYEAAFVNGCGDLDFFVLAREAVRVAGL
jgi:3-hydroxyisobutyrate dehydrogenase-like beta-hydroxyacid dehydrogenase